ncbi:MAG: hypothetical protein ACKO2Z_34840 [Sphaerospermopsis kisseleviana]
MESTGLGESFLAKTGDIKTKDRKSHKGKRNTKSLKTNQPFFLPSS